MHESHDSALYVYHFKIFKVVKREKTMTTDVDICTFLKFEINFIIVEFDVLKLIIGIWCSKIDNTFSNLTLNFFGLSHKKTVPWDGVSLDGTHVTGWFRITNSFESGSTKSWDMD